MANLGAPYTHTYHINQAKCLGRKNKETVVPYEQNVQLFVSSHLRAECSKSLVRLSIRAKCSKSEASLPFKLCDWNGIWFSLEDLP